uniref:Putative Gcr2 protein n=1 Tax=Nakaseomyces delphensis TaxID=51657 RepID=Q707W6_NAKDE|nr:putative Gcr2 protein [Nakaseomyces delphensis]
MDEFNLDLFIICAFQMIIGAHTNSPYNLLPDNSPTSIHSNFTNITTPLFSGDNNGGNNGKFEDLYLRTVFNKIYNLLTNTSPSSNLSKVFFSIAGNNAESDYPGILYRRFLTVRRKLQDNYADSKFSQFFTQAGELKDYSTLSKNKVWTAMQNYIMTVYDPTTDKLLPPKSWTTNNSPRRQSSNQSFANLNQLYTGSLYHNNNSISNINRELGNYTLHMNNNKSLNGYYTQPTSPTPNDFSINFSIPPNNIPNNTTTEEFESAMADILQFPVNSPNDTKIKRASSLIRFVSAGNVPLGVEEMHKNTFEEMKNHYNKQVAESDKRIHSLTKELEQQRQETMWLRKLLLEAMGDIRSTLNDMRRQ